MIKDKSQFIFYIFGCFKRLDFIPTEPSNVINLFFLSPQSGIIANTKKISISIVLFTKSARVRSWLIDLMKIAKEWKRKRLRCSCRRHWICRDRFGFYARFFQKLPFSCMMGQLVFLYVSTLREPIPQVFVFDEQDLAIPKRKTGCCMTALGLFV